MFLSILVNKYLNVFMFVITEFYVQRLFITKAILFLLAKNIYS